MAAKNTTINLTDLPSTATLARRPLSPARYARRLRIERATYLVASAGIATGPALDAAWPDYTALTLGATSALWLYHKAKNRRGWQNLLRTAQRTVPVLTGAGLYAANWAAPGLAWWELAAPATWALLMAWAAPITRARLLPAGKPAIDLPTLAGAPAPARPATHPELVAYLWQQSGIADGTRLTAIRWPLKPGHPDFEAVIVAQAGRPLPRLETAAIAAVYDVPETAVETGPVPGSGPGRLALTVRPTLTGTETGADPITTAWAKASRSGGPASGVELLRWRREEDRLVLHAAAPESQEIRINHTGLCSAFGIDDTSRVVIESDGVRQAIIWIYRTNPLLNVREATATDLIMDAHGCITIGVRHDGRPLRVKIYDPDLGALRGITAGATGAGKSVLQLLILAGERHSGVVSWVADLQGGKSLPEAEGRVDWFAKGEDATMALLRTAHAVMTYREHQSRDRADFELGDPWPLLNITLDEINRLLSHPDEEMKTEAAALIADIQKTGRKVGVGIRLAVQSLHLKDLGGEEAIRQQGKTGTVVLMRTLSSSTQSMGLDGIAPPGFYMANIPARIHPEGQIDALFNGEEETGGVSTAGMAYFFNDGRAEFGRTFYAHKEHGRYAGIGALMDAAGPLPTLTPGEAEAAGTYYRGRNLPAPPPAERATGPVVFDKSLTAQAGAAPGVGEQILGLLADGPKSVKELREALPDITRGTISNRLTALREDGLVHPVSRGVWALSD